MIDSAHLDGKVALIAGVSPELVEATARRFATLGAAGLMICGRNVERGQAVAAIVSAAGCPAHFMPADLARPPDCAAAIADADQVFGRIDVLVTGAGAAAAAPDEDISAERFDQLAATDVRAPFLLIQGAAGVMRRRGTDGTMVIAIGRASASTARTPLGDACEGALASMAASFGAALIRHRIRVFGLLVNAAEGANGIGQAARAIAALATPDNPTAPGSIVDLAAVAPAEPTPA